MTKRIKESERRKMLMNYAKDGTVPEGFYVVKTKKDQIQFRHKKEQGLTIEKVKAKIEHHKKRLQEFENLYKILNEEEQAKSLTSETSEEEN